MPGPGEKASKSGRQLSGESGDSYWRDPSTGQRYCYSSSTGQFYRYDPNTGQYYRYDQGRNTASTSTQAHNPRRGQQVYRSDIEDHSNPVAAGSPSSREATYSLQRGPGTLDVSGSQQGQPPLTTAAPSHSNARFPAHGADTSVTSHASHQNPIQPTAASEHSLGERAQFREGGQAQTGIPHVTIGRATARPGNETSSANSHQARTTVSRTGNEPPFASSPPDPNFAPGTERPATSPYSPQMRTVIPETRAGVSNSSAPRSNLPGSSSQTSATGASATPATPLGGSDMSLPQSMHDLTIIENPIQPSHVTRPGVRSYEEHAHASKLRDMQRALASFRTGNTEQDFANARDFLMQQGYTKMAAEAKLKSEGRSDWKAGVGHESDESSSGSGSEDEDDGDDGEAHKTTKQRSIRRKRQDNDSAQKRSVKRKPPKAITSKHEKNRAERGKTPISQRGESTAGSSGDSQQAQQAQRFAEAITQLRNQGRSYYAAQMERFRQGGMAFDVARQHVQWNMWADQRARMNQQNADQERPDDSSNSSGDDTEHG